MATLSSLFPLCFPKKPALSMAGALAWFALTLIGVLLRDATRGCDLELISLELIDAFVDL
jgi:hypothetical protein